HRIHAPPENLDGLIDGLTDAFKQRGFRGGEPDRPAADVLDVDRARPGAADGSAERLRQFPELGQPRLQLALADDHLARISAEEWGAGQSDARLAQDATDIVLQRQELLPTHIVDIDLEQDMRAALQIEAEDDVALRPCRPALDHAFREEVGNGEQA